MSGMRRLVPILAIATMAISGYAHADDPPPAPSEYEEAEELTFPLTPEEVRRALRKNDEVQKARAAPVGREVTFRSRSVNVRLDPGVAPERVVVAPRNPTTLTFSDMTGQPWPLLFYVSGNPDHFDVKAPGCDENGNCKVGSNMVMVTPLVPHAQGNLVVTLKDQPVPITIDLRAGSRSGDEYKRGEADARVDMRLSGLGPNAMSPILEASTLHKADDQTMLAFLDGVPPRGAEALRVVGLGDVQAWRLGDRLYIRTPHAILSPAWLEHVRGVSGLLVYAISETPVVLLSVRGAVTTIRLGS